MAVRLLSVSGLGLATLLLGSCSIRLQIDSAIAEPLSEYEVAHLNKVGEGASVAGTWFVVAAIVPRTAVRKIARWELYTHISVDDCRTGQNVSIVPDARIQGTDGSFEGIRRLLKSNPDQNALPSAAVPSFEKADPFKVCAPG